jgi:hypothetical protein
MSLTSEQASKQHAQTLFDTRKKAAKEKIYNLIRSYPKDTPDEWVVFGYGGTRVNLGDLKDLFGVER